MAECTIVGVLPSEMVVLSVPVESCLGMTGDLEPLGLDLGENCSGRRIISSFRFILPTRRPTTLDRKSCDVSLGQIKTAGEFDGTFQPGGAFFYYRQVCEGSIQIQLELMTSNQYSVYVCFVFLME